MQPEMPSSPCDMVVVLGPTASGKTQLAVKIAEALKGEIISADSRQVYRGLDIGSGKDLDAYQLPSGVVRHHLIDCTDLDREFSVFHFQQLFYEAYQDCRQRGRMPVLAGGTGLYLESVLMGYRMAPLQENDEWLRQLETLSDTALAEALQSANPAQHNTTDLVSRARMIQALRIAKANQETAARPVPDIRALVLGVRWPRPELYDRIRVRLQERLDHGMLDEVTGLHRRGVSWERLRSLGLEYRYCADFLLGQIGSLEELTAQLAQAICKFAKRQETWFRRMERRGTIIHWIEKGEWPAALARLREQGCLAG